MTSFGHVFQPVQLRHKTLKNRVVFGAHTTNMAVDGLPGDQHIAYYVERAMGGAAMIVVEPMPVHPAAVLTRGNFRPSDDAVIPHFRRITEACKSEGAVMIQQLYHVGAHGDWDNSWHANWSPSGGPSYHDNDGSRAMSEAEIEETIDAFVQAAIRCQKAGFDGVDLDEAGGISPQQARDAVAESGVFVHNAINHAHWQQRFTSANENERHAALDNLLHCIRVSHAAGGSGVLLVPGSGNDGSEEETVARSVEWISKALPLAASLGQRILFENVWNQMFYQHNEGPEQSADGWADYVDAFNSPWVGMYHDIGNHWKYGNPADWIRTFGHRAVKFDVKGYDRASNNWAEIDNCDLPWGEVREALDEVNFHGWFTAEVGGGGVARLTTVREQMQRVLGLA